MRIADLIKATGVNQEKTKYLVVSRQMSEQADLQIDGNIFQQVTDFSHLRTY